MGANGNGNLKLMFYVALAVITAISVGVSIGAYRATDLADDIDDNCKDIQQIERDLGEVKTDSAAFQGRVAVSLKNIEDDIGEIKEAVNDLRRP